MAQEDDKKDLTPVVKQWIEDKETDRFGGKSLDPKAKTKTNSQGKEI
jgi:hypothetical protein